MPGRTTTPAGPDLRILGEPGQPAAAVANPVSKPAARDGRAAVEKALALLAAFGNDAANGVSLSELARRTDLPKSTAFRLLGTMQRNGAVERTGNVYRPGTLIQNLGAVREPEHHTVLREVLTPHLVDLYQSTKQTVHLAVLQGTDVVYLNKLYGHTRVRTPSRIGGRAPAHCTAVGKLLLAPDPEATEEILAAGLIRRTAATIIDPKLFRAELATIRQDNLAFDRQETQRGLSCIAAPVFDPNGTPLAAFSISCPANTFNPSAHAVLLKRVGYAATRTLYARWGKQREQVSPTA